MAHPEAGARKGATHGFVKAKLDREFLEPPIGSDDPLASLDSCRRDECNAVFGLVGLKRHIRCGGANLLSDRVPDHILPSHNFTKGTAFPDLRASLCGGQNFF